MLPVDHALGHDLRNRRHRAGVACQVTGLLGTYIRRQHEYVPLIEPYEVHLGIQERAMFAVPDRVVDDQKRQSTAIAMAHRHFAVEGLGALIEPLLGGGEKSNVVLCRWQDVARIIRGKACFLQKSTDLRIVPEFLGKHAGYTICVWCRTHGLLQLGKALRLPSSEYCH